MDVGLWRIAPGAEIQKGCYDYESHSIGPYSFVAPIEYIQKYHIEMPEPDLHFLYKMLLGHPQALCVFFTNNTYVAVVTEKSIIYTNVYNGNDVIPYTFQEPLKVLKLVPIGFVKTRTDCVSVATLPYQLFYSMEYKCVYFKNEWVQLSEIPSVNPPVSLYKDLLENSDAEGIYADSNNKLYFLK